MPDTPPTLNKLAEVTDTFSLLEVSKPKVTFAENSSVKLYSAEPFTRNLFVLVSLELLSRRFNGLINPPPGSTLGSAGIVGFAEYAAPRRSP